MSERKCESFVDHRIILIYRNLNLLNFQIIQVLLLGSVNSYFNFVNMFLQELGAFLGNRDVLFTQWLPHHRQIMKSVYVSKHHRVSATSLKSPWSESECS